MRVETLIYETEATKIMADNPNMMIPFYLMASYAYYKLDDPIFSDSFYEELAKTMIDVWEGINHTHKYLITLDALKAGSYIGEYPSIVIGALESFKNAIHSRSRSRKRK
jgi:hypothetical protein